MILDCHTHVPWRPVELANGQICWDRPTAVEFLKRAGVAAAISNPNVRAATAEEIHRANEAALRLYDETNGYVYPGACVHPGEPAASNEWLERLRGQGFFWVGELVTWTDAEGGIDEDFRRLLAECERHGHIVQLHNHEVIPRIAREFPRLRLVHSHVLLSTLAELAELANVWLDLSGFAAGLKPGYMEKCREVFPKDRLLFGSDFTVYDPRCYKTRIEYVFESAADREGIYSGNLIRLLKEADARPMVPCL